MSTSRPPFRTDLEALRGLAILLVVAYHAGVPALAGGFVGVDVFFVLSGFFTTRLLVREYAATGSVDLAAFYGRRARRLLPALLVVVAATLAAVWTLYAPIDRAAIAATARSVALGTANNAFARQSVNYFGGADSPFLHTWSLAVEQQVSLFGPLLFLALAAIGGWTVARRREGAAASEESSRRAAGLLRGIGVGLALVAALSFAAAVWLTGTEPSWAFFGSAARAWEFAIGGLLALLLPTDAAPASSTADAETRRGSGWWFQVAGLLALALAAIVYDRNTPYPGFAALLPVLGAAAIVAGGARGHGALSGDHAVARALRWLGTLSYSWYLWHWPIVVTAAVLWPSIGVAGRLAWSVAALGPAWLTLRLVERPARGARTDDGGSPFGWPAAALAGCVALALGAGALRQAAVRHVKTSDQRRFATARHDRMTHECWGAKTSGTCVFGDPRGATTVALFGDSHAEHWLGAVDRLGRERGWRVVLLVNGGCPVSDAPELNGWRTARRGRECAAYREASVRRLIALRPAVAILSSWDEYVTRGQEGRAERSRISPEAWGRGLRSTYGRLAGAGVPVVAIRGTPQAGFDVPACLSRRADRLPLAQPCTFARSEGLHAAARAAQEAAVRDAAARGLRVRAVDMADVVCPTARCAAVQGRRVVYTDDNHLAASFTRAAAPILGARLDGAARTLGVRLP
ncbi:acyltransferase family protein [Roseisolibacter agri]|uniref:Acyltransferase n=1 Tax=Roseisolibacter agri TaxID=2014610 RepID=A0AA37Q904_9BACT|nr:acyltransferase family protein [Roseisolibacter agri]GLC26932.1 acyltransferase [Roseisolibacter agri]